MSSAKILDPVKQWVAIDPANRKATQRRLIWRCPSLVSVPIADLDDCGTPERVHFRMVWWATMRARMHLLDALDILPNDTAHRRIRRAMKLAGDALQSATEQFAETYKP